MAGKTSADFVRPIEGLEGRYRINWWLWAKYQRAELFEQAAEHRECVDAGHPPWLETCLSCRCGDVEYRVQ